MTVKTITYQKLFPIGQYMNERLGVEIQVDAGEDPEQLFEQAKEMVNSLNKKWNANAYSETFDMPLDAGEQQEQAPTDLSQIISKCTDAAELRSWRIPVYAKGSTNELKEQYENKLRELSNIKA